jgi:hypothetical protein
VNWRNFVVRNFNHEETKRLRMEVHKCRKDASYFLSVYVQISDAVAGSWIPFRLWPSQQQALQTIVDHRRTVILKARQLGLTALVLGYALWQMLFHPEATVLLFSRRDDEAVDLLKVRLRGMYDRLPDWMKVRGFPTDNDHELRMSNGSRILAFPTTGGDSYTANLAIIDEADLVPDLPALMASVKPTIEGGGRMILVSRADKGQPNSMFKRIYHGARLGRTEWKGVFLPWSARPDRDAAWYEAVRADILHRTGSLDELYEQYPATDTEALMPRTMDKRIPAPWLLQCLQTQEPWNPLPADAPAVPGLEVYVPPLPEHWYVIGADPAEGNPTSDDSALTVLDGDTGEEAAALAGKIEPSTLGAYIDFIGRWYNNARVLVERNNHGHAVLTWLWGNSELTRLYGHDHKPGWVTSARTKAILYDAMAEAFQKGETRLHSYATFVQLAAIDGRELRAPQGEADDRADSYALAWWTCRKRPPEQEISGPLLCWPQAPGEDDRSGQEESAGGLSGLGAILADLGIDVEADDWQGPEGFWTGSDSPFGTGRPSWNPFG